MTRILGLGLLLSMAVVWGQPVEGPFEIMLIDSGMSFNTPQVIITDSVTAHVYCSVHESDVRLLWRFAHNIESNVTEGFEELYVTGADALTLGDAKSSKDGEALILLDDWDDSCNVYLLWNNESGLHQEMVYAGHVWDFGMGSYDLALPMQPSLYRLEHGWAATWTINWVNSIGWCIQVMNYPAIAVEDSGDIQVFEAEPGVWQQDFEVSVFPQLVTGPGDTVHVIGRGYSTQIQAAYLPEQGAVWQYPRPLPCELVTLAVEQTHGGRWLVYSGSVWGQASARVAEINMNAECSELGPIDIPGNPSDIAWHPDFGFAVLYAAPNSLQLVRVDTNGIQTLPAGTLFWRDSLAMFADASVAITDSGEIVVVWTEQRIDEPAPRRLMLGSVGWDTPLSANPSDFVSHPSSFILSAYPNPFNSELQIEYDLPRAGDLQLAVFNVLGQKVAELENGLQNAGVHQAVWSPNEGSGIYFVQMKTEDGIRTEKVLLAR